MERARPLCLCLMVLAACGETPTSPVVEEAPPPSASEAVTAYLPAIHDTHGRILPTVADPRTAAWLANAFTDLERSLRVGEARQAIQAMEHAQESLNSCDDHCLVGPDRSVLQLTIDHAARLLGLGTGR